MAQKLTAQEQKAILEYQKGDTSKMTDALLKKVFTFLKKNVPDLQGVTKVSKKDELNWVDNFINLTPRAELKSIIAEEFTVEEMQKALGLLDEANIKYTFDEESEELVIEGTKEQVVEAWKGAYTENPEYATEEEVVFEDVEDSSVTVAVKFEEQININESLSEIFGEDVSKEFLGKATKLFEAVVTAEVTKRTKAFEEEAVAAAAEIIEEQEQSLVEALDQYASEAAEEYIRENEEQVRSSLQLELSEQFMEGLKGLFEEFYVEIPEGKLDVMASLSEENENYKNKANDLYERLIEAKKEIDSLKKEQIILESSRNLSESQQEQLKELVEDIEFDEDFASTLETIKKVHFGKKATQKLEEEVVSEQKVVDPYIQNTLLTFKKK
jgi:hypothetical protein